MAKPVEKHNWTEAEEQYIRDNYKRLSDGQLSIELGRILNTFITPAAVRDKRRKMKLRKSEAGAPFQPKVIPDLPKVKRKIGRPPKI